MKRVRLTVAYDGTNYHGWQVQDNGITIEAELNRCLSELFGEKIGSSEPAEPTRVCMRWEILRSLIRRAGCPPRKYPTR